MTQHITAFLDPTKVLPRGTRSRGKIKVYRSSESAARVAATPGQKVVVTAHESSDLAELKSLVKAASNRLVAVLLASEEPAIAYQRVRHSGLRKVLVVPENPPEILARIYRAWTYGHDVAADLIAWAQVSEDGQKLYLTGCDLTLHEIPMETIPMLRGMGRDELLNFEVSEDGDTITWLDSGKDGDLESFLVRADPERLAAAQKHEADYYRRYGAAIRVVREAHGVRQVDIEGLTSRQVRRIEQGISHPRRNTLTVLAAAHNLTSAEYRSAVTAAFHESE